MKKSNLLLAAGLLAAANQAGATIEASVGKPGELFLAVYDSTSKKTYYKDLGITFTDFVSAKAGSCIDGNISKDPKFAEFLASNALVYTVAAANPLYKGSEATWGYLLTSETEQSIFPLAQNKIDQTTQNIQGYSIQLNGSDIGNVAANISGVYEVSGDLLAGYEGGFWGSKINNSLTGSAQGKTTTKPKFYQIDGATKTAKLLGDWNFTGGVLQFAGTGTTAVCGGVPTPTPTPTPTPAPVINSVKLTATPAQATVKAKTQISLKAATLGDYSKEELKWTYQKGTGKKLPFTIGANFSYNVTKTSTPPAATYDVKFPASAKFVSPKGTTFEACTVTTKVCSSAKITIKQK